MWFPSFNDQCLIIVLLLYSFSRLFKKHPQETITGVKILSSFFKK